ncbi:MAG: hypothetical protein HC802_12650 [Caldilineaceae bacterium]|nr:hypothetical protein [Caldilineaceae bacterium]
MQLWDQARKTVVFITHSIEEALILGDRVLVMSATPGRLIGETTVPFPRPRAVYELKRDPTFGELSYQIWELLRDEVNAARSGTLPLGAPPLGAAPERRN